ncbi:ATP-binding cassette domain-containing protein [Alphaproteobacteria bacterium]|nr:ATP-binding cassette domain-containing protein [Alphaproteobacteria bacterium]
MTTLIEGIDICLTRQERTILSNVSLKIDSGDFITLIGPNGAGKSMLLKTLLGLIKPDSGRVIRKDGLRIGFVPESLNIDPTLPLSVKRFLTLNANKDELDDEIIAETNITDLLDRQMTNLSGGERQRVLLARALHAHPEILILDEPAQNLDMSGQLNLYALMEKIFELRKIAILMVSHDLHLVMSSTQKVVCLYEHICCSGEPQAVAKDPEFISLFGQDMARLLSVYPHAHDHSHDHDHEHDHNHNVAKQNEHHHG